MQLDKHVDVHFIVCMAGKKSLKITLEVLKQVKGHPQVNYL